MTNLSKQQRIECTGCPAEGKPICATFVEQADGDPENRVSDYCRECDHSKECHESLTSKNDTSEIAAEIARKAFEGLGNPDTLPLTEEILTAILTSAFDNYQIYLETLSGDHPENPCGSDSRPATAPTADTISALLSDGASVGTAGLEAGTTHRPRIPSAPETKARHLQPRYVLEQIMNNSTDSWAKGVARTCLMESPEETRPSPARISPRSFDIEGHMGLYPSDELSTTSSPEKASGEVGDHRKRCHVVIAYPGGTSRCTRDQGHSGNCIF